MIKRLWIILWAINAYGIRDEGRLSFRVSLHDLNRIEVKDDRIHQVFGNKGAFIVEHDTEKGHLYLIPTSERPLSLTIVSEGGVVQDLLLIPVDGPGETVILGKRLNPEELKSYEINEQEIQEMSSEQVPSEQTPSEETPSGKTAEIPLLERTLKEEPLREESQEFLQTASLRTGRK